MKLLSIQVGKVQTHEHNGKPWQSGYIKKPVERRVMLTSLNLEGDQQHNKHVHGGVNRAVLMYSAENYEAWEADLGEKLPNGSFAENFTVEGLHESTVCIGDIYQIGDTVKVQVAQPRQPCNQIYKVLGIRGIEKKVTATHRSGWYLRVLVEGEVEAGMSITLVERFHPEWTIEQAHTVMNNRATMPDKASELSAIEELEPGWRAKLAKAATKA
ncbi:MAG: MOSC domain-containing protein [Chloroflexota bacterium]